MLIACVNLRRIFSPVEVSSAGSFRTRFRAAEDRAAIAGSLAASRTATASVRPWRMIFALFVA